MGSKYVYSKAVKIWLFIGVVLVFGQVVIGGITRLTDSGLSITEWEVIKGTLPPLNEAQWTTAFDKYKVHAKTQFEAIHADMSLKEFKWIYFWEYFHRLWARSMGLVFLFPFLYFLARGQIDKPLIKKLGVVILLAMLAATFGWIMVKSGLNTADYAWVNAYKLMMHLGIAFALFGFLLLANFHTWKLENSVFNNPMLKRLSMAVTILIFVQILFGGLMSGMKAGLSYPTWPSMNGKLIAGVLLDGSNWTMENLMLYNKNAFAPALVQVLHRFTAYFLTISVLYLCLKLKRLSLNPTINRSINLLLGMLIVQFLLGVFTLMYCKGSIPVVLGVLHQAGGLLLLGFSLFLNYLLYMKNS